MTSCRVAVVALRRSVSLLPVICRTATITTTSPTILHKRHYSVKPKQECVAGVCIVNAARNDDGGYVSVSWNDGRTEKYPYVWLRDNCQCPECFHPVSQARLLLMQDLDINIKPTHIQNNSTGELSVTWPDGHESHYNAVWLRERSFTGQEAVNRDEAFLKKIQLWDNEMITKVLPRIAYEDLMTSPKAMLDWLTEFHNYGFALVQDVPGGGSRSARKLANKIAFRRITHYGKKFIVKSKIDPSNVAYTGAKLGVHTDLTYYDYMPGIQSLYYVQQCEGHGGENHFVDGFSVAKHLQDNYPDIFEVLSTYPVDAWDIGSDYTQFHKILRTPIFRLNEQGNVSEVRYNNQVRDSFLKGDVESVKKIYEAFKMFDKTCYDKKFLFTIKVNTGDMAVFDNHRVLHGRNGFSTDTTTERELEGMYLDWDEVLSTIRVLRTQLNKTTNK